MSASTASTVQPDAITTFGGHIWRAHTGPAGIRLYVPYSAEHIAIFDKQRSVWHATTTTHLLDVGDRRRTLDAVCGRRGVIQPARIDTNRYAVILWPVPARPPWGRCRECWIATGKKRPHEFTRSLTVREPTRHA